MKKNKDIVQIFEKLGTPLMAAVNEVSARQLMGGAIEKAPSPTQDAEKIAGLLTVITKVSVRLADKMDFTQAPEEADDVRLALTAVASPLVANMYQLTGHMPTDTEIEKFDESFGAIKAYSDNFMALSDGADRMKNLDGTEVYVDSNQVRLQTLQTLIPAVNAVTAFPFGLPPAKLLRKISDRLVEEAEKLADKILGKTDAPERALGQISLLRALVMVYSQCHFAEMSRIMGLGEKAREEKLSIEPVWQAFDQRLEMIMVIASTLIDDDDMPAEVASGSGGGVVPEAPRTEEPRTEEQASQSPQPPQPSEAVSEPSAPVASTVAPAAEPAPEEQSESEAPKGDASNPMSFFSGKKSSD